MSDELNEQKSLTPEEALAAERADRDERIAELEARLARPPRVGVKPVVAAVALLLAGYLVWQQRRDFSYYFSTRDPIQLGTEGDYHFDLAVSNRYATFHGIPTSRGAYSPDGKVVALGVRDTPVMVWREALETEAWQPPAPPPRPDQRPFAIAGRLLKRDEAPAMYENAFENIDSYGEVSAKWVLVKGQRPGEMGQSFAWMSALVAFALINLWLLIRGLVSARQPSS